MLGSSGQCEERWEGAFQKGSLELVFNGGSPPGGGSRAAFQVGRQPEQRQGEAVSCQGDGGIHRVAKPAGSLTSLCSQLPIQNLPLGIPRRGRSCCPLTFGVSIVGAKRLAQQCPGTDVGEPRGCDSDSTWPLPCPTPQAQPGPQPAAGTGCVCPGEYLCPLQVQLQREWRRPICGGPWPRACLPAGPCNPPAETERPRWPEQSGLQTGECPGTLLACRVLRWAWVRQVWHLC